VTSAPNISGLTPGGQASPKPAAPLPAISGEANLNPTLLSGASSIPMFST
jgi:hypothetical protein